MDRVDIEAPPEHFQLKHRHCNYIQVSGAPIQITCGYSICYCMFVAYETRPGMRLFK